MPGAARLAGSQTQNGLMDLVALAVTDPLFFSLTSCREVTGMLMPLLPQLLLPLRSPLLAYISFSSLFSGGVRLRMSNGVGSSGKVELESGLPPGWENDLCRFAE